MTIQVKIEKLVYGGMGFSLNEGRVIFVPGTVPGDLVEIEIVEEKKGFARGEIKKIVEPSPNRLEPPCKYFEKCGGCHWQYLDYPSQLNWKQKILEEQLVRIGGVKDPDVLPTIPSPEIWNYRNRIQVHIDGKKIGFYEEKSHNVVDVDYCMIAEKSVNESLRSLRDSEEACHPQDACHPCEGRDPVLLQGLDSRLRGNDKNVFFTQVNPHMNIELKKILIDWTKECEPAKILELYSGNGNFTFDLADIAKKVTAVESDYEASKSAIFRAKEENRKNIFFYNLPVEEVDVRGNFDLVVLDPPRDGLTKAALKLVVSKKPKSIIYISCDPATLCRDIKQFAKFGYKLKRSQPIDMFPQTYHIESITLLSV